MPALPGIWFDDTEPDRGAHWTPILVVLVSVGFSLWLFRGQANPPVDLNDSGLHLSMTDWASRRLGSGHNPFDGWFPSLGLGFPQTHHYQSLPHVVTAAAGIGVGVREAYHWSLYLLLAGWPLAVYGGARLLGLGRWPAACAAILAPWLASAPGYGYEAGSYTWQGLGIWPQLWAAWLLPIAIGLGYRAVFSRLNPIWAGLAIGACTLCHFLTGWLALAIVALLPLLRWRDIARQLGRLGLVLAAAAAAVAWFVVPMFLDRSGADYTGYERGTFWYDSFGAIRVGRWLVTGSLFDEGRLPVVTVLAAVGLVVAVLQARVHVGSRVVLLLTGLSLVLFFGRPTLGIALDALPYGKDLFYPRFIMGVHLGGLLLAGIGASWLGARLLASLELLGPPLLAAGVVAVAGLLVLAPVVRDGVHTEDSGRAFMSDQRDADAAGRQDLLDLVASVRGEPGRVFAGTSLDWGASYKVGYVPVYAELLDQGVDSVGFLLRVSSVATSSEALFDETDPISMAAFGVRWLLLPADRTPKVPATLVGSRGSHQLWLVTGSPGYAEVVDGSGPIEADADTLDDVVRLAFQSGELGAGRRPLIKWHGRSGDPTAVTGRSDLPGQVKIPVVDPANGRFTFQVVAKRDAYIVLAASWHPRWQAIVDGKHTKVVMAAPGVAATRVAAGTHAVTFEYVPYPYTWAYVLFGLVALVLVGLVPRRLARTPVSLTGSPHDGRPPDA